MAGRLPAPKMLTGSGVSSSFTRGGGDGGNSRRKLQSAQSNCCRRHVDNGVTEPTHQPPRRSLHRGRAGADLPINGGFKHLQEVQTLGCSTQQVYCGDLSYRRTCSDGKGVCSQIFIVCSSQRLLSPDVDPQRPREILGLGVGEGGYPVVKMNEAGPHRQR